jgi:hypothetical protein
MVGNEMQVFKPLEDIVKVLLECPDPSSKRASNGYHYIDSPRKEMASEIVGANRLRLVVPFDKPIYFSTFKRKRKKKKTINFPF